MLISTQPNLYKQTYTNNFHCIQTEYTSEDAMTLAVAEALNPNKP